MIWWIKIIIFSNINYLGCVENFIKCATLYMVELWQLFKSFT